VKPVVTLALMVIVAELGNGDRSRQDLGASLLK